MGFDNDCILNIQSLAGEYFCPVCHLLVYPNEALQAPCTHLYCKPCLTYVVSTTHACPYDGYRVTEADCKPLLESNKALADTIGKIQVHCLYYRTGCTWQGTLTDCSSHYATCSFGDSPVLCNRCSAQIVHRQVQEHAQNCPGAQSQALQTSTVQDTTSTGGAVAEQNMTATQTGIPASQAQTSQTSQATDANQAANPAAQPQATQAAMPTPEQWQQYQQQYQQYYQQYPGYDPYQQNYQYYYQYQQGAQQYAQQPMQGYPPQPYGQAQPQVYAQAPVQPHLQAQQVQSHAQPQLQQQPQVPSQTAQPQPTASAAPQAQAQGVAQAQMQAQGVAQPQMQAQGQAPPQMQAQAQAQAQPHMQAQGQAPPQMQAQAQAQPHMQVQGQAPSTQVIPYNQSQPYAQPQPITQQMQVPQYQLPQGQYSHSQPYHQLQTAQNYPYQNPQSQVLSQPHSQPTLQGPTYPPSQQNQPINSGAQFPTQNAVSGYQSYPQPQPQLQGPGGAAQPMAVPGAQPQPQYPAQMQGKFSAQPSQMYAPQPYSNTPNQQLPAASAHGQPPSGQSAQQQPVFPHSQQPGYPIQHRPGVQAAQQTTAPQQYGQQQSSVGHFPYMQPQPPIGAHPHAQGPPQVQQSQQNYAPAHGAQHNMAQSYAPRPVAQGAASQSHAPAAPHAGVGQIRPSQPNQTHPLRVNNQMSAGSEQQVGYLQQPARTGGEKPRDQVVEKSKHDQNNPNKLAKNVVGGSGGAGVLMDEVKMKAESGLDNGFNGNENELPGMGSKSLGSDASHSVLEPSPGSQSAKNVSADHKDVRKKADSHDSKQTVKSGALNTPQPNLITQARGTNAFPSVDQGRNQPHPMQFGPSAQLGGAVSMPQSTPHSLNSQQSTIGHPPHLRQSGPGQAPPRPPFNSVENSQPSSLQHPPGPIPHENASGAILTPGTSGPFPRPSNMGYYQGNLPAYQAGQPQVVPGEPFGGSAFAAQRFGAFDSHVGARERADFEQRPSFPVENEKFFDGRNPESLPHGSLGRAAYGPVQPGVQPGGMRTSGPPHDSISAPGMRDERGKPYSEEQLKHFPHRDFEDDPRKLSRPPHFEAGRSSKLGTQFPSSGPLDHGHHVFAGDGPPRPFDKASHGFDRDPGLKNSAADSAPVRFLPPFHPNDGERGRPSGYFDDTMGRGDSGYHAGSYGPGSGPGFGRSHMDGKPPRSPGRDFSGLPSRAFGAFGDGGNSLPAEQFGKSINDSRFPVPPNHLQRGEIDVPGSLRVGGPHNQDMLPNRLRRDPMGPRNMHMGEPTHPRMGEPPLAGNFQQHLPFGESFSGEKPGHPLIGEPGFRGSSGFQRFGREGGLYPEEMEPFDDPRRWKPVGIMCRICKVECGTVEGLDLHSQSREHQKKARDMVLSIKQQNKKQRISKGQAPYEGRDRGRSRNPSFQGRGNKY